MLPLLHPSSGTGMLGMWRYEWMMTMSSISRQVRQVGHTHTHSNTLSIPHWIGQVGHSLGGACYHHWLGSGWILQALHPISFSDPGELQHKTDTANCTSSILIICLLSLKHQFHSGILPPPCWTAGIVDLQLHFCFIWTQDFPLSAAFGSRVFFLAVNLSSHSDSRHTGLLSFVPPIASQNNEGRGKYWNSGL